jgi:hypothetical protein
MTKKAISKEEMYRRQLGGTNAALRREKQRNKVLTDLAILWADAVCDHCVEPSVKCETDDCPFAEVFNLHDKVIS